MKYHESNRIRIGGLLILINIILTVAVFAQTGDTFTLEYKFKKGDKIQYKTERHDSTSSSFAGLSGMKSTSWSLNTLSVVETPSKDVYKISIEQDSTWFDEETASRMNAMTSGGSGNVIVRRGSGGGGTRMRMGESGRPGENSIEITKIGRSTTDNPVMTPFVIPFPDKPVSVNETWDFDETLEHKGRTKGKTNIKGQCLLYEVRNEKGKSLAVIIVNSERHSTISMQNERDGVAFSVNTESSTTGFHLVFFNIDKGIIEEIDSEDTTESAFEMSGSSNVSSSASKSTIKLISK
jgi:hypothetical protein